MRDKTPAMVWVVLILGLVPVQGCASFAPGDPSLPGHQPMWLERSPGTELSLYGGPGDRTYLGCLWCPDSHADSLDNPRGRFRSTSGKTIFNRSGLFGSSSSNYSPCNRLGTSPPVLRTSSGVSFGRLTINMDLPDAVQVPSLRTWISAACAVADGGG
jgi:hypothetical protein